MFNLLLLVYVMILYNIYFLKNLHRWWYWKINYVGQQLGSEGAFRPDHCWIRVWRIPQFSQNRPIFTRSFRPWAGYRPPSPPRGNFVHYDFLKLHYIRHKIKDVSPLRVAALTCTITLYTLPPKITLNVPDNVSTMACSYIFACWHRSMNFL